MGLLKTIISIVVVLNVSAAYAGRYVPGEIIVKMKNDTGEGGTHQFIGKASMNHRMSLKRSWRRFNIHQFRLKAGKTVEQAVDEIMADPNVEFAEPNYIFEKQSAGIEGAPLSVSEVQALDIQAFAGGGDNFNLTTADIKAEEAWAALSATGNRPVIAVIDSGVDYNHYVFVDSDAIWKNTDEIPGNGIDDDGNGYVDDVRGWNFAYNNNDPMDDDNHGTHVAGIVLGMTQDILKANVEPAKVQIMPLKFLDSNGVGSTSAAIEAINYAVANGANVMNNSWGGGSFSQALQDAIVNAYDQGLTFVAAAGNATNNNDSAPTYPSSYSVPNVISIAATNYADDLAGFSNFGASSVHVASPGVSILSTLPNDSFGYSSGTSMAAPFAAGLAALMIHENPGINGYQVKGVLFDESEGVGDLYGKVASQSRINALKAVEFAQNNSFDDYQPEWTGSRGLAAAESAGGAGGCGMVAKVLSNARNGKGGGKPPWGQTALLMSILFAPVMMMNILRRRRQKEIENRRNFPRYDIESSVKINVGGKELMGQMSSLSLGGAKIDTEALLENGGIVTLSIESPGGEQQVQVQGKVVWSEEKKSYGVQFCDAKDDAIAAIGGMTQKYGKLPTS